MRYPAAQVRPGDLILYQGLIRLVQTVSTSAEETDLRYYALAPLTDVHYPTPAEVAVVDAGDLVAVLDRNCEAVSVL